MIDLMKFLVVRLAFLLKLDTFWGILAPMQSRIHTQTANVAIEKNDSMVKLLGC